MRLDSISPGGYLPHAFPKRENLFFFRLTTIKEGLAHLFPDVVVNGTMSP